MGLRHASRIRPDRNIALICSHEIACLYVAAADVKKSERKKEAQEDKFDIIILLSEKKNAVLV